LQTWGQGIYATPDKQDAASYGQVIGMKLDSSASILRDELQWAEKVPADVVTHDSMTMKDNYSMSDIYNLYWAGKGYDGFQPHGGEMVLFNTGKLTLYSKNVGAPITKFNPYHDEKGRFSTGDGYAQGGYTAEQTYRQNQMKGKGLTAMEIQDAMQNFGEYSPEQMVAKMQEIYGAKVSIGKGLTAQTVVTSVRVYGGNQMIVTGDITNQDNVKIGVFERVITQTDSGVLSIDNHLLKIGDEYAQYRGMGLAKAILRQGDAYAVNTGVSKITVFTAWDGARTWARAGFDWSSNKNNLITNIQQLARSGYYNNLNNTETPAGRQFVKLMSAMSPDYKYAPLVGRWRIALDNSSNMRINPINDKNFPIPNDFAMIGHSKAVVSEGAKMWAGKTLLNNLNLNYEKIINPEMMNIKSPPTDRNNDGLLYSGSPRETLVPLK